MTERSWAYKPIPMTYSSITESKIHEEEREKSLRAMEQLPWFENTPAYREAYENPSVFQDPDTGEYVRGMLEIGQASRLALKNEVTRGITSLDKGFQNQVAKKSVMGRDLRKYDDTILAFTDSQEKFMIERSRRTDWNSKFWEYESLEQLPIYDLLIQGPEDLFDDAPPEGWTIDLAIQHFKDADPDLYYLMSLTLGGDEGIRDTVAKARNPVEFFYMLNHRQQAMALTGSIDEFEKRAGTLEENWEGLKSFVVNGILDDPDMAGSWALSLGLAAESGGTSVVGGLIASIPNSILATVRGFRYLQKARFLSSMGRGLAFKAKWVRNAIHYMPENLGPTLIKTSLFKDTYKHMGFVKKHLVVNRLADSAEGLVSGGLAEFFNQRRMKRVGMIDEIGYNAIASEALFEAMISPIINPIMGGAMLAVGGITAAPATLMSRAWEGSLGKTEFGKTLGDLGKSAMTMWNPDALIESIDKSSAKHSILRKMNELLVEGDHIGDAIDSDPMLATLFETIKVATGLDSLTFLQSLEQAIDNVAGNRTNTDEKLTSLELAVNIANQLATVNPRVSAEMSGEGYAELMSMLSFQVTIHENARDAGISVEDYMNKIEEEGAYFDLLPTVIKEKVYEAIGGQENAQNLTDEQLREKAAEIQLEIINERRKINQEYGEKINRSEKELNRISNEADEVARGTGVTRKPEADDTTKDEDEEDPDTKQQNNTERHHRQTKESSRTLKFLQSVKQKIAELAQKARRAGNTKKVEQLNTKLTKVEKLINDIQRLNTQLAEDMEVFLVQTGQTPELIALGKNLQKLAADTQKLYEKIAPTMKKIEELYKSTLEAQAIAVSFFVNRDTGDKIETISAENLTEEQKNRLKDLQAKLPENSTGHKLITEVLTEGKGLNSKEFVERVIDPLSDSHKKALGEIEGTSDYDHWLAEFDNYKKAKKNYEKEFAKYQQQELQKEIVVMTQITGVEAAHQHRQEVRRLLAVRKESLLKHIEGRDTLNIEEVIRILPADSDLRKKLEAKQKKGAKTIQSHGFKEEVEADFENTFKKTSKIGPGTRARYKHARRAQNMFANRWLSEVKDSEALAIDYDPSWIVNKSTIGNALAEVEITLENDHAAWTEWHARLSELFQTTGQIDANGTISTFRLLGTMPDYFHQLGLGVHVIFDEAIVRPESEDLDPSRLYDPTGVGNVSSDYTTIDQPTPYKDYWADAARLPNLRWRVDTLREIVDRWRNITKGRMQGFVEGAAQDLAKDLLGELLEEGHILGLSDLNVALTFASEMVEAERQLHEDLFNEHGFVLDYDETTGFPTETALKTEGHRYESRVKRAIRERVVTLMGYRKHRKILKEKVGIELTERAPKSPEEIKTREAEEIEQITDYIINNLNTLNEVPVDHPNYIEFTLIGMGDGTISWVPSTIAGHAIVDTFAEKPVPEKGRVHGLTDGWSTPNTEDMLVTGEPVMMAPPLSGDLNTAAPAPLWDVRRVVENFKFRARIKAILKRAESGIPLTKEEKDILYNTIEERRIARGEDPVADEMDVFYAPQIIGGHLQEEVITREQAKEFMLEIFLDMAQIGHSINQDSQTVRNHGSLRFRDTEENPMPLMFKDLNVGYHTIVPWGRIGETLALEEMSPNLDGLTKIAATAHIKLVEEWKENWERENPDIPWSVDVMLDPSNHTDQVASGLMITTLLSKIGDEGVSRQLAEIEAMLAQEDFKFLDENGDAKIDEDGEFLSPALMDMYISSGMGVVMEMMGKHNDNNFVKGTGVWKTVVFQWLLDNDITNKATFKEAVRRFKESGDTVNLRKALAIREYFKVPVLRRLYGGGLPSFRKEFLGPYAGKRSVIIELNQAFGIKITDQETENLGRVFLGGASIGHLLDAAMGFTKETRKAALRFLAIPRKNEFTRDAWLDICKSVNIPSKDSDVANGPDELTGEGEQAHVMDRLERVRKDLYAKIDYLASRMPGGFNETNVAKLRKKYQKRFDAALKFMEEVEADPERNLDDGSPDWERLQEILHGDTMSWKTIRLFRAMNIMNSTTYKLNMQTMKDTAIKFGFVSFKPEDWMGLERLGLYHLNLPTQRSPRSYHKGKMDVHGIFANRVAVEPEQLKAFMDLKEKEAIADHGEFTEQDFVEGFSEFLTNEEPDAMGMWDIQDNVFEGKTVEEADAELDFMMDIDQLLYMASHDTLPKEIFPDYTAEDSPIATQDALLRQWYNDTKERSMREPGKQDRTVEAEIRRELRLYDMGEKGHNIIRHGAKIAGGVRSPYVARALNIPLLPYARREYGQSEAFGRADEQMLYLSTVEPQGLLSMQPLYRRRSFFDRGVMALQRIGIQRKMNKIMDPIKQIAPDIDDPTKVGESPLFNSAYIGWISPWKKEHLPLPEPITVDELLELNIDDRAGRKAAQILNDMRKWARARGVSNDIKSSEGLIYWYIVREIERTRKDLLNDTPNYHTFSETSQEREEMARRFRMRWIEGLHAITHFSRDIKYAKNKHLTIMDQAADLAANTGLTDTEWINLLTNKISEDNPHGQYLSAPTRLDSAIRFILPAEHVLLLDKFANDTDKISYTELQMLAMAIQSTDFNLHLLSILYTNDILPNVLKQFEVTLEDGSVIHPYRDMEVPIIGEDGVPTGKTQKMWRNPHAWETHIDPDHVLDIIAEAKMYAWEHGGDSIIFDTLIEEHISSDPKKAKKQLKKMEVLLKKPDHVGMKDGARNIPFQLRGSVFAEQLGVPTEVQGKTGQLALSPEKALELFGLLETFRLQEKVKRSKWSGRSIGMRIDPETGKLRARKPVSTAIKDALGHNETEIRAAELLRSEALGRVLGLSETRAVKQVTDRTRRTGKGIQVRAIDLDHYATATHNADLQAAWVESYLSPIQEMRSAFAISNTDLFDGGQLRTELKELVEAVRSQPREQVEGKGDANLATAMWLSLLLQLEGKDFKEVSPKGYIYDVFIGPLRFTDKVNAEAFAAAQNLMIRITQAAHLDEMYMGLNNHIPLMEAVREWAAFAAEEEGLAGGDTHITLFLDWVKENKRKTLPNGKREWTELGFNNDLSIIQDLDANEEYYKARVKNLKSALIASGMDPTTVDNLPETLDYKKWLEDGERVIDLDIETAGSDNNTILDIGLTFRDGTPVLEDLHNRPATAGPIQQAQARQILSRLEDLQNEGYKIVTFNGNAFDLLKIGIIANLRHVAARIALRSIDGMQAIHSMSGIIDTRPEAVIPFFNLDAVAKSLNMESKYGKKGSETNKENLLSLDKLGAVYGLFWLRARNETITRDSFDFVASANKFTVSEKNQIVNELNTFEPEQAQKHMNLYLESDARLAGDILYGNSQSTGLMQRKGGTINVKTYNNQDATITVGDFAPAWFSVWKARDQKYHGLAWTTSENNFSEAIAPTSALLDESGELVWTDRDGEVGIDHSHQKMEYIINFALGQEVAAIEADRNIELFGHEESDLKSTGDRLIKLANNREDFNEAASQIRDANLDRIVSQLNELEAGNRISHSNLARLRALIARVWAINPTNLQDFNLNYLDIAEKPAAIRDANDNFVIRLGNSIDQPYSNPNIALVFAHELGHMGRMKWVADNSGTWRQWKDLYYSPVGRNLLYKIVKAWNGGNWTANAEKEFRYYLSDPEEYIAAVTGYYLVNDTLPALELSREEAEIHGKTKGIVGRIMDFVRNTFLRVSSVLSNFRRTNPKTGQHVQNLVKRTLGWDPNAPNLRATELQNKGIERELLWDVKFEEKLPEFKHSEAEFQAMALEHDQLLRTSMDDPQFFRDRPELESRFYRLDEEMKNLVDSTHMMTVGITRYDYMVEIAHLKEVFPGPQGSLDLEAMLNSIDWDRGDAINATQLAAALQYAMDNIRNVHGDQFRQGAGVAMHAVSSALSNFITKGKDPDWFSRKMADLLVGKSGANFHWNGPHPFVILLSQVINDDIATSLGQYTNKDGAASVARVLDGIAMYQDGVIAAQDQIETLLQPILKTIFGNAMPQKNKEVFAEVWLQIMKKVEDPSHEITLGRGIDDNLGAEKLGKMRKEADIISTHLRKFMGDYIAVGKELGIIREGFSTMVPIKLTKAILDPTAREGFVTGMTEMITERIQGKGEEREIRIDPLTMFCGRLLPRMDSAQAMIADLAHIKNNVNENLYNFILFHAAKVRTEQMAQDPLLDSNAVARGSTSVIAQMLHSPDPNTQSLALEYLRGGIINIMKQMNYGQITWTALQNEFHIDESLLRPIYTTAITTANESVKKRIASLDSPALDGIIPQSIHFSPHKNTNKPYHMENLNNPVKLHISNIINRGTVGMYYPNDSWALPTTIKAAENPAIRPHLILNPREIMADIKKGKGDQMFERQMLVDRFGIFGTVTDLINLFETVASRGPGSRFYNLDGTPVTTETQDAMIKAGPILRGKHGVTRGIKYSSESPSRFENFLAQTAPGLTRTVFGGNLALATYTVEGIMNTFQELFGRGNLVGAIRGIFAPFWGMTPEVRKRVARDLVHTVEALTKSFIPDHEMPANAVAQNWLTRALNFTGHQAMRPAQHMLKTIAMSRAISARLFITDEIVKLKATDENGNPISRLHKLAQLIHDEPLGENPDPSNLRDRMRRAGFSTILDSDLPLISYMLRAGLLNIEDGSFTALQQMIQKGIEGHDYYSPSEMFTELLRGDLPPSHPQYQQQKALIQGLRFVEKGYIEEVLVTPNAFDIFTPTVSKTGEVSNHGTLDSIFEIFRRYPMLFVSQHVYRKANRLHPMRYAFGLSSMLVLDIVYMMALRLAMGAEPEDLIEEFEEEPAGFTIGYAARLPILGRYMGLISEVIVQIPSWAQGKAGREPGGFVPMGALLAAGRGAYRAIDSQLTDDPAKWQDTVNAMRVFPIIGDRLIALAFYNAAGDSINRRGYKGGSSGGGGGQTSHNSQIRGHYGMPAIVANLGYDVATRQMLEELLPEGKLQWSAYAASKQPVPLQNVPRMPYRPTQQAAAMRPVASRQPQMSSDTEQKFWKDWGQTHSNKTMEERAVRKADIISATWDIRERIKEQKGTSSELVEAMRKYEELN